MKNKLLLLPYFFQYIGWALFVFAWVFLFASLYIFNTLKLFSQNYSHYSTLIIWITLYISALFVAFSKEKREDEYIMNIRANSVIITVYICFLLYIALQLILAFNQSFRFLTCRNILLWNMLSYGINPVTMFMMYVVVFRVKMYRLRRALKNAE